MTAMSLTSPRPSPEALLRRALQALRSRDYDEAESLFAEVLDAEPEHPLALHYGGLCAFHRGKRDESLRRLRRSLVLAPREAPFWANAGMVLESLGLTEEACDVLLHAAELDPRNGELQARLGTLLFSRGYHRLAATALEKALEIQPENPRLAELLARALNECGRREEAGEILERALARHPQDPSLWMVGGDLALTQDDHKRARSAFEEAARLAPASEMPKLGLVTILTQEGRFEEAAAQLRGLIAQRPGAFDAWSSLFTIVRPRGEDDPDLAAARALLARNPDLDKRPEAEPFFFALGQASEHAGLYEEAFRHYGTANRLARAKGANYSAGFFAQQARSTLLATGEAFRRRHTPEPLPPPPFTPIYIVGMPRSGTSLMEQMLAAHPLVAAGGEMSAFHALLLRELTLPHLGELPARLAGGEEAVAHVTRFARGVVPLREVAESVPAGVVSEGLLVVTAPLAGGPESEEERARVGIVRPRKVVPPRPRPLGFEIRFLLTVVDREEEGAGTEGFGTTADRFAKAAARFLEASFLDEDRGKPRERGFVLGGEAESLGEGRPRLLVIGGAQCGLAELEPDRGIPRRECEGLGEARERLVVETHGGERERVADEALRALGGRQGRGREAAEEFRGLGPASAFEFEAGELEERRRVSGFEGQRAGQRAGAFVRAARLVEGAGEVAPESRFGGGEVGRAAEEREPFLPPSEEMQVESGIVDDEGVVGMTLEEAGEAPLGSLEVAAALGVDRPPQFEGEDGVGRSPRRVRAVHRAIIPRTRSCLGRLVCGPRVCV